MEREQDEKKMIGLIAIDREVVSVIPLPTESAMGSADVIRYGQDNAYPDALYQWYKDCAILQTIINGTSDYVMGNGSTVAEPFGERLNEDGMTLAEVFARAVSDYLIFGAAYLLRRPNLTRDGIAEIDWLDARKVRKNKNGDVYLYATKWGGWSRHNAEAYPRYSATVGLNVPSVVEIATPESRDTYALPLWGGAVKDVIIQTKIADFHLNEISNGFASPTVINFNNGTPSDEEKDEIEKRVTEKFCGSQNAGRTLLSFNDGKDTATTIAKIASDNYEERYESLAKRTRQQIFVAFRAVPALFGLMSETTGFSEQEFAEAFDLYNRTMVVPIRQRIVKGFERATEVKGVITINPFSVNGEDGQTKTIQ